MRQTFIDLLAKICPSVNDISCGLQTSTPIILKVYNSILVNFKNVKALVTSKQVLSTRQRHTGPFSEYCHLYSEYCPTPPTCLLQTAWCSPAGGSSLSAAASPSSGRTTPPSPHSPVRVFLSPPLPLLKIKLYISTF